MGNFRREGTSKRRMFGLDLDLLLKMNTHLNGLLFLLAFLLNLALSDSILQANIDFTQSLSQANLPLLERVEQKAILNYNFILNGDGQFSKYPDLDIVFTLPFDQYVKIKYHTSYICNGECYLYTGLVVDGQQNRDFRDSSEENKYGCVSTSEAGEVFLKAGTHRIYVQYKTNNERRHYYSSEYNNNMLSVQYHRQKST